MGGRGKTPVAAQVGRLLVAAGERPAILSRGYRRRRPEEGVVIVSDGRHMRADLDRSGDEPMMLARHVPGAAVLVCDVRALAAAVAESVLGATVHVLDDGFQHRSIARDIDIVIVSPKDLRARRLPFGPLRSPVSALQHADAVIVDEGDGSGDNVLHLLDERIDRTTTPVFSLRRALGAPWWIEATEPGPPPAPADGPVVAVAGIATPARFHRALTAAGWNVAAMMGFGDHHAYRARDVRRIVAAAAAASARAVLTTEKDAMRLLPLRPLPALFAAVPLTVSVEPARIFGEWLLRRLGEVRS
jgi:tetraacyldisaccharide 4'-kinase